ncbi:MAG: stage 0 sporulation family protein [Actinomycetota bacterium]|nr:stage 0 sporulation family protein [Actinomycetota bacterium]MCL6092901.1 stage 0 sporulation family protein [Actinomycetota bacterium]MDA8166473.1 stage 0 sporulation family protein [Actinomycetota bacterium]
MPELVEIVFRSGGKVYSFDPAGLQLNTGDQAVVRTSRGIELGKVVVANHEVRETEVTAPLEKVVRLASPTDLQASERNDKLAGRAAQVCEEKIREHGLGMRLINTEVVFDGSKIILSFFSEERVDFRRLVEDLARKFKTRIEFRQVGVRDEARLIGGYGPCGRKMCCTMFAGDQQPVSIKMAKEQNLPLNPMKISGICGRLMCCLKYEHESYREFRQKAPKKGAAVSTSQGEGVVVDFCVPKELVMINLGEGRHIEASLAEIGPPGSYRETEAAAPQEKAGRGVERGARERSGAGPAGRGRSGSGRGGGSHGGRKQGAQATGKDAGKEQSGRPQGGREQQNGEKGGDAGPGSRENQPRRRGRRGRR